MKIPRFQGVYQHTIRMDKVQQSFRIQDQFTDQWYFYVLVMNNLKMKLKTLFK